MHLRGNSQRGQSLVELAISLTAMLLLLSGAVSFGMAYYSYVSIRDAAQEGALYGSFNPCVDANLNAKCDSGEVVNLPGIRQRVRAASTSPVDLSSTATVPDSYIQAQFVPSSGSNCEGSTGGVPNAVQVSVEYDYPIFMPFMGAILGSQQIHLRATVTDTILEPRCETSP
jgi:Flp pilus assembly protein TadG